MYAATEICQRTEQNVSVQMEHTIAPEVKRMWPVQKEDRWMDRQREIAFSQDHRGSVIEVECKGKC